MMNMMNMMKQAQTLQKKLMAAQEELETTAVKAEAGNGAVKVVCNGKCMFQSIKLSAEAINPDDPASVSDETIEMLEDLITAAMQAATKEARNLMDSKMKDATGGLSLPGLSI